MKETFLNLAVKIPSKKHIEQVNLLDKTLGQLNEIELNGEYITTENINIKTVPSCPICHGFTCSNRAVKIYTFYFPQLLWKQVQKVRFKFYSTTSKLLTVRESMEYSSLITS